MSLPEPVDRMEWNMIAQGLSTGLHDLLSHH